MPIYIRTALRHLFWLMGLYERRACNEGALWLQLPKRDNLPHKFEIAVKFRCFCIRHRARAAAARQRGQMQQAPRHRRVPLRCAPNMRLPTRTHAKQARRNRHFRLPPMPPPCALWRPHARAQRPQRGIVTNLSYGCAERSQLVGT